MNDFHSGFLTILGALPDSAQTAKALVEWIVAEWGGIDLYFSRSLRGDTEVLVSGLGRELARLRPDASPAFLEQFQKAFHGMYSGMDIYVPLSSPWQREKTYQAMWASWKAGESVRSLAKRHGYSIQWTYRILNEQVKQRRLAKEREPGETTPPQTTPAKPDARTFPTIKRGHQ